jgi:phosphatidylinositol glycan class Z
MWRRTYLFLVLVRLWFALSPSYLHPDENFQGPEVIAGTSRLWFCCFPDRDQAGFLIARLP